MTALAVKPLVGGEIDLDIDAIIDTLSVIADWKRDLHSRIARARLIFELVDADHDFQALAAEVAAFKRACACLAWRGDSK
jgi:hypothetical protein